MATRDMLRSISNGVKTLLRQSVAHTVPVHDTFKTMLDMHDTQVALIQQFVSSFLCLNASHQRLTEVSTNESYLLVYLMQAFE